MYTSKTKSIILFMIISMLLLISAVIGTTFAWIDNSHNLADNTITIGGNVIINNSQGTLTVNADKAFVDSVITVNYNSLTTSAPVIVDIDVKTQSGVSLIPTRTNIDEWTFVMGQEDIDVSVVIKNQGDIDGPTTGLSYIASSTDTMSVSRGSIGAVADISIAEYFNGKRVNEIADNGFNSIATIETVNTNFGIRIIGDNAFSKSSITSIVFSKDSELMKIDNRAFGECFSLTSIVIPPSVTYISSTAFYYCKGLVSIEVHAENQNYQSIEANLYNKTGTILMNYAVAQQITEFIVPESVTEIAPYAFLFSLNLTNVRFEENSSLDVIRIGAFERCYNLKSIDLPNNITKIERYAFSNCNNLISINIPNTITQIDRYAFAWCKSLTNVTFAEGSILANISNNIFEGCSSLTSIDIPASVINIGDNAFKGCINLITINMRRADSIGMILGEYWNDTNGSISGGVINTVWNYKN